MKASKPGCICNSAAASFHWRAITGLTGKPSRAWRMASLNKSSKGSLPNLLDNSTHCDTTPGTVTDSQPRCGMVAMPLKRSGDHAAGARPEAFSPCKALPSHKMAKASPPMPFIVGSTTVKVIAAARAASIALPPRAKALAPACEAKGCEVETTLRANTG